MSLFDVRNLLIMQFLIFIICAVVMMQVWHHHHQRYRGIGFWAGAMGLAAVAFGLLALRDVAHVSISILLGNSILLFAMLLLHCGFRRFYGNRPRISFNIAIWLAATGLLAVFTWWAPDLAARIVVINTIIALGFAQILMLLMRQDSIQPRASSLTLRLIIIALFAGSMLRVLTNIFLPAADSFLESSGLDKAYLIAALLGVIWFTMSLSLLVSRRLLDEVRFEEGKFNSIFSKAPYAAVITQADGRVVAVNDEMLMLLGYQKEEVLSDRFNALMVWQSTDMRSQVLRDLRDGRSIAGVEMGFRRKDGTLVPTLFSSTSLDFEGEELILSTMKDISEINRLKQELLTMATHDLLTGLPNRALYTENFTLMLAHAARTGEKLAVVILDIDDFKMINDQHGHDGGDQVLVAVAQRLRQFARAGDIVARHGGDEFTLLLGSMANQDQVRAALQRMKNAFHDTIAVNSVELTITISIGVSLYPHDGQDLLELLRKADTALYEVKRSGKNGLAFAR